MKKGLFITFEGTEGGGKSTQIRAAASFFRKRGKKVTRLREPGGTRIGEAIRRILLDKSHREMAAETELLLYLSARAQIIREKILPALERGEVVISDRYEDSTLAYQGYGRGLDPAKILAVSRHFVRGSLRPDKTFLLDLDPKIGLQRGGRHDRIELQSLQFHHRVRRGFLKLAARDRKRFVCLDASRPKAEVTAQMLEVLRHEI